MIFPKVVSAVVLSLAFAANALAQDLEPFPELSPPSRVRDSRSRKAPDVVPSTYIVQLKKEENGLLSRRSDGSHAEFHRLSKKADLDYTTRQTYSDSAIFVGLSLTLSNDADLQALKDLDNVIGVWPVQKVPRPLAAIERRVPSNQLEKRAVVPGTNVTQPFIVGDTEVNQPLTMAKVNELHAQGIKGKGIKIAIIDTGVDYRHPALGGCFGAGCKIAFGYDFINDSPDPLVTCIDGGHGTHTSGIVGMQDVPGSGFGLVGVAPEATLGMYRVFDCLGSADTDIIISAMLQAVTDGANLISMSFGAVANEEEDDPWAQVTSALVEQGLGVFASAGNNGASGVYLTSAPAIGKDVFAVGSVENTKFPVTYELKDNTGRTLRYSTILPLDSPEDGLTVQVVNFGGASALLQGCFTAHYTQAAANLTSKGLDPANFILAVKNGGCSAVDKANAANLVGYKYLVSYTTSDLSPSLQNYAAPNPAESNVNPIVLSVQDSTTFLGSYAKKPGQYKVSFSSTNYGAKSGDMITPGLMSNYSSIGPEYNLNLKPQLSAPGGQILATWPLEFYGGYAIISGTSMSCPFMAGVYALIRSQRPELSVHETYAVMQTSGSPLPWYYDSSILTSVAQQGSGIINAVSALKWESQVLPTQLNLGFSPNTVTQNLTITNRSTRSKTYTFTHRPAGGMQYAENFAWQYGVNYPWYASASFSTASVVVQGGQSATIQVSVTPPTITPLKTFLYPFYTGYVVVNNNYETYIIPYVGSNFDE